MELDQLRTFLAVVEQRSLSRAATTLHVSQSTVSFHLKTLEADLGTRLVDRGRAEARPTASGTLLLRYARKLLTLHDEARARVGEEERGEAGHVTVAASNVPAEYLLPSLLVEFHAAHPGVAVTVHVHDSQRALAHLLADECDLAVVSAQPRHARLETHRFADDEIVLVAPTRGELTVAARLSPGALSKLPLVEREPGSGTREAVDRLLSAAGVQREATRIEVGSNEAVRRCVLAGRGLAFLSRLAVVDDLTDGRLRRVAFPGTPLPRRFVVAVRRGHTPSAAARALLLLLLRKTR